MNRFLAALALAGAMTLAIMPSPAADVAVRLTNDGRYVPAVTTAAPRSGVNTNRSPRRCPPARRVVSRKTGAVACV